MTRRGSRRGGGRRTLALLVLVALGLVACGNDDTAGEVSRPPLSSPPDPGEVPATHGLSEGLVADVLASSVAINGTACGRRTNGSGFAIASDLVVTNAHVILGLDVIEIVTFDGEELVGRAVAFDPDADLAIVEVTDAEFSPLAVAEGADDGTVGMLVGWAEGAVADPSPFRIDRPVTVRIERVGSVERIDRPSWLVAADIEKGDSGGALVDPDGKVVGVAYAASRQGSGVGYAVRASEIDALIAKGFDQNLVIPDC